MSNSLAVAMVTAALRHVLAEALLRVPNGGVANAGVTMLRPDKLAGAEGEAGGINVFLYEVASNAHANSGVPTRRADGSVVDRPGQALDLHYLLTFTGDDAALEPQRMLGVAMTALAARPVLSRGLFRELVTAGPAATSWERYSDLADQVDAVRLTQMPLTLDELSKIWSTFFHVPYRLSVAYEASAVLLDADVVPQPALPVREPRVDAVVGSAPSITRVLAGERPTDPVVPGAVLRIEGERLRGAAGTVVRIGEVEVRVPDEQASGSRLTVALPAGVPAGVRGVQVRHPSAGGTPAGPRVGAESAAAAVVVRPAVTGPVTAVSGDAGIAVVTLAVLPEIGPEQRVTLLLNGAHSYALPGPARAEPTMTLRIPVTGVEPGNYLVRVSVDGAESVLAADGEGRYDRPRVRIP